MIWKLKVLFVSQNTIKSQELVSFKPVNTCVLVRILFLSISVTLTMLMSWFCNHHSFGGNTSAWQSIVGKNQSTQSKTTVRSKREFPFKVRRGPLHCVPQCRISLECKYWRRVVVTQTHYWLLVYLFAICHHSRYWNFFYHYW